MSRTLLVVPLIVAVLFVAGAEADASEFPPVGHRVRRPPVTAKGGGAQADDASEFLQPFGRRVGQVPPPPPPMANGGKANCPMIKVPSVANACHNGGVSKCSAQCVANHYRGGHCDIQPNGSVGDCTCINCIGFQA